MTTPKPRTLLFLTLFAAAALPAGAPPDVRAAVPAQVAAGPDTTAPPATTRTALWGELNGVLGEGRGEWSVLAVSLDRGDTLFARSPHRPLAPASNIKLLTTAAALHYLGPGHRFATYLVAVGPVRGGVLEGDLYLYGTGDPTLGTRFAERPAPALLALADSLAALGVREVRGRVVGDGSHFAGAGTGEGWPDDHLNAWFAPQAGALSVHENLVRVEVAPGPAGGRPELSFVPGGRGLAVRNQAVTGGSGGLVVARKEYGGPVVVDGAVNGAGSSHAVLVGDPSMYAAGLFRDVLQERGIAVRGGVAATDHGARSPLSGRRVFAPAAGEGPPVEVLAVHRSEPLVDILRVVNHQSHNFYSEQVLRAVGRAAGGDGSAESGARAVKRLLAAADVDTARIRMVDGCGLSPLNRVSAADFVALLDYMERSSLGAPFREVLPIAGETRRFRRMGGTPAGGNLQAKTGTIDDVSALSGYVTAANGERIAFSIIGNDLASVGGAKAIENRIGVALAAFDRGGGTGVADSGTDGGTEPAAAVVGGS